MTMEVTISVQDGDWQAEVDVIDCHPNGKRVVAETRAVTPDKPTSVHVWDTRCLEVREVPRTPEG